MTTMTLLRKDIWWEKLMIDENVRLVRRLILIIFIVVVFGSDIANAWQGLSTPKMDIVIIDSGAQYLPNTEYLFMVWSINEYDPNCILGCNDEADDQEINFEVSGGEIIQTVHYSFSSASSTSSKVIFKKSGRIKVKESNVGYVKLKTPSSGTFAITVTGKEHDTDDYNYIVYSNTVTKSFSIYSRLSAKEYFAKLAEQRAETLSRFKGMYLDLIGLSGGSWNYYANQKISEAMILSYKFTVEVGQSIDVDPTDAMDAAQGIYDILTGDIPFIGTPLNTFQAILNVGTGMVEKFIDLVTYTSPYGRVDAIINDLITLYGQEASAWRNNDKQALKNTLDKEYALLMGNPSGYYGHLSSLYEMAMGYKSKTEDNNKPGIYALFYSIETFTDKDATKTIPMLRSSATKIFNSIPDTPILYTPADNSIINTLTPTFDWNDFTDPDLGIPRLHSILEF